jgi:hypothetical protein
VIGSAVSRIVTVWSFVKDKDLQLYTCTSISYLNWFILLPLLKTIPNAYTIYFNYSAFGKVGVEFRRNGPVSNGKPVPNPKPPDELGFLRFGFYPCTGYEAEAFVRVYEQQTHANPFSGILAHILPEKTEAKVLTETVLVIQPNGKFVLTLLVGDSQKKPNVVKMIVRFLMLFVLFLGCQGLQRQSEHKDRKQQNGFRSF